MSDCLHVVRATLERIAEPYPTTLFTPLSDEERRVALETLHGLDYHASERLHAEWARHLQRVALSRLITEGLP